MERIVDKIKLNGVAYDDLNTEDQHKMNKIAAAIVARGADEVLLRHKGVINIIYSNHRKKIEVETEMPDDVSFMAGRIFKKVFLPGY